MGFVELADFPWLDGGNMGHLVACTEDNLAVDFVTRRNPSLLRMAVSHHRPRKLVFGLFYDVLLEQR